MRLDEIGLVIGFEAFRHALCAPKYDAKSWEPFSSVEVPDGLQT
jgi:hypothetical protein